MPKQTVGGPAWVPTNVALGCCETCVSPSSQCGRSRFVWRGACEQSILRMRLGSTARKLASWLSLSVYASSTTSRHMRCCQQDFLWLAVAGFTRDLDREGVVGSSAHMYKYACSNGEFGA